MLKFIELLLHLAIYCFRWKSPGRTFEAKVIQVIIFVHGPHWLKHVVISTNLHIFEGVHLTIGFEVSYICWYSKATCMWKLLWEACISKCLFLDTVGPIKHVTLSSQSLLLSLTLINTCCFWATMPSIGLSCLIALTNIYYGKKTNFWENILSIVLLEKKMSSIIIQF